MKEMEAFYTAQEVADLLKIRKTTVYELIKKNVLPSSKVGKQIRISQSDLDAYLNQGSDSGSGSMLLQSVSQTVSRPVPQSVSQPVPQQIPQSVSQSVLQPVSLADAAENVLRTRDYLRYNNGLIVSGQDEVISIFSAYFQLEPGAVPVILHSLNLYDSLYSLYFDKVHAAFAPILQGENHHLLHCMVPGVSLVSVQVAEVSYGIYIKKENPCQISNVKSLLTSGVRVMKGEKGSVCRIVLDQCMMEEGIDSEQLCVCERESISSLAAAAAVDSGQADAAVGSRSILTQFPDMDFIPLRKADLKLVFCSRFLNYPAFQGMVRVLQSEGFKRRLMQTEGYECSGTGDVTQI